MDWERGWRKPEYSYDGARGGRWHCTVHMRGTDGERQAIVGTHARPGYRSKEEAKRAANELLEVWKREKGWEEIQPGAVIYRFDDDRINGGEVYRLRWRNGWIAKAGVPGYGTAVGVGRTRGEALTELVREVLEATSDDTLATAERQKA